MSKRHVSAFAALFIRRTLPRRSTIAGLIRFPVRYIPDRRMLLVLRMNSGQIAFYRRENSPPMSSTIRRQQNRPVLSHHPANLLRYRHSRQQILRHSTRLCLPGTPSVAAVLDFSLRSHAPGILVVRSRNHRRRYIRHVPQAYRSIARRGRHRHRRYGYVRCYRLIFLLTKFLFLGFLFLRQLRIRASRSLIRLRLVRLTLIHLILIHQRTAHRAPVGRCRCYRPAAGRWRRWRCRRRRCCLRAEPTRLVILGVLPYINRCPCATLRRSWLFWRKSTTHSTADSDALSRARMRFRLSCRRGSTWRQFLHRVKRTTFHRRSPFWLWRRLRLAILRNLNRTRRLLGRRSKFMPSDPHQYSRGYRANWHRPSLQPRRLPYLRRLRFWHSASSRFLRGRCLCRPRCKWHRSRGELTRQSSLALPAFRQCRFALLHQR